MGYSSATHHARIYHLHQKEVTKVLRSYLNILLFEVERMCDNVGWVKPKNSKQDKIRDFEVCIEKHFQTHKLPSDYAEMLCVRANYLNKICKEETGQTAGDIIRKPITIEAHRLLHYTNDSANEISNQLGFENASYFVTFFKHQTKMTPEQFRKIQE